MEQIITINNLDVSKHISMDKDIDRDICMKSHVREMFILEAFRKRGLVKPLSMWGCKLCKKGSGRSNFTILSVSSTNLGDAIFCMKHGFLDEQQTFRRKRSKSVGMNRGFYCMNTEEEMLEAQRQDSKQ